MAVQRVSFGRTSFGRDGSGREGGLPKRTKEGERRGCGVVGGQGREAGLFCARGFVAPLARLSSWAAPLAASRMPSDVSSSVNACMFT